jgi:hypothetical protein
LPPTHLLDKWHEQQMRQRQPDRAKLPEAWLAGIEDPSGDVQVCDGIAIEQQQLMTRAESESCKREYDAKQSDDARITRQRRRFSLSQGG